MVSSCWAHPQKWKNLVLNLKACNIEPRANVRLSELLCLNWIDLCVIEVFVNSPGILGPSEWKKAQEHIGAHECEYLKWIMVHNFNPRMKKEIHF